MMPSFPLKKVCIKPGALHQAHWLWVPELPQLPDTSPALCRQTQLAGARFDRGAVMVNTLKSDEPSMSTMT
ncbi:MAG: hypothetical protein ACP5PJ_07075, partial [Acidimicrobiales bacterium]